MIKNVFPIFVCLILCSTIFAVEQSKKSFNSQMDKTKWIKLKNNFGWEVNYPSCWEVYVTGDDIGAKDAASVNLKPGDLCPVEFPKELHIQIVTPPDIKSKIPGAELESVIATSKRYKEEYKEGKIFLNPKETPMIYKFNHSYDPNVQSKELVWIAHSNCDNRNLHYSMLTKVSDEERKQPLEKQKMPEVLKKITETFVCTKP